MNFYVYKLYHIETREFYIGSRKCECDPENDIGYMGSMSVWKPDKSKLIKSIISSEFDSRDEAMQFEKDIICEYINDPLNRNYHIPNTGFHVSGMTTVKDKNGNTHCAPVNSQEILDGYLVPINTGMVPVKDKNGNRSQIRSDDPRYRSGELTHITKGMLPAKDKNGVVYHVSRSDPRYKSGELVGVHRGMTVVKDKNGNCFSVSVNDPRFLNGELVGVLKGTVAHNKGVPMSEEQKGKLRGPKTKDHKMKLSESAKNRAKKKIICLTNGIIYQSMKDAAIELGLTIPNIINVMKGRAKATKGYSFEYYTNI